MIKKWSYILYGTIFFIMLAWDANAQTGGTIKGQVLDEGEPAEGAIVMVIREGTTITGAQTDFDGLYMIPAIPPGAYDIKFSYAGKEMIRKGIRVSEGLTTPLDPVNFGAIQLEEKVTYAKKTLIKQDETKRGQDFDQKALRDNPVRGVANIASQQSGVFQKDANSGLNISGARGDATQTFVDGVRVIGSSAVPQSGIENVSVIVRGVPPWYGDVTSGVIEITTSQPSAEHHIGGEVVTSQLTDAYGYNLAAITASGPLIRGKENQGTDTTKRVSVPVTRVGYMLAVEGSHISDASPSAVGVYKLKDDVLKDLEQTPLVVNRDGNSFLNRGTFIREKDVENVKAKQFAPSRNISLTGRLDFKLGKMTTLKVGASGAYGNSNIWDVRNSMYSPKGLENRVDFNLRTFVRFNQTIIPDDVSKSVLKGLTYWLQADFSLSTQRRMVEDFGDDLFKYGYVGKFDRKRAEVYGFAQPGSSDHDPTYSSNGYWKTVGFADTAYVFDPSTSANPVLANFNKVIYDYYAKNPRPLFQGGILIPDFRLRRTLFSPDDLFQRGGILNGLPGSPSVYSLWDIQGSTWGGYGRFNTNMIRVSGQASFTLGKKSKGEHDKEAAQRATHTLKVGFEFDQRQIRGYSLSATGLWQLMRNLTNKHLDSLDLGKPMPVVRDGEFRDTVHYLPAYNPGAQSHFDSVLRAKLGLPINGLDQINIDGLDPSQLSVNMFSADELLNGGKPYVSYYGYDPWGNTLARTAPGNFFTDPNRPLNAFAPTYIAGYIQDKFEMDNLYLTVGLRVDRLDLNQKVLKDKYVFGETFTAAERAALSRNEIGSNIGSDWVPYVDNLSSRRVVGYRNNDNWYDSKGNPTNPALLAEATGTGRVVPDLKSDSLTINAFKDYEPQINLMPRVSFSFPITNQANFFAHYDVLVQRPTGQEIGRFTDYKFIVQNATDAINNPDLKPQQTIDYEVGFQQNLDKGGNSAIVISAFYREMRNMIQVIRRQSAYPITYDSYENLDFGTVKGFTFEFKTNRISEIIQLRTSYTLQYAQGTGSSAGSSRNALGSVTGFSVLRNLQSLSFDQRHTLTGNINLSIPDGYLENKVLNKIFKTFNTSLTFNIGSGTPYTRNALPNQADVQSGVNATIRTKGMVNGSNLPWSYRFDLRVERTFMIGFGKKKDEAGNMVDKSKRKLELNVYLIFINLLNTQNVFGVYAYSGLPDDAGFLNSPFATQYVQSLPDPVAFTDQYKMREKNPGNFSLPRQIRLGCIISF